MSKHRLLHVLHTIVALAAVGWLACTHAPTPAPQADATLARPLFWRATNNDGKVVYLLGSIHVGPPGGWTYPATIEDAFAQSDVLYVEFDSRTFTESVQEALMAKYAMLPSGEHLRERIGAEQYARLTALLEDSELYPEDVGRLRPWMVANVLNLEAAIRMGLSPMSGVDAALLARSSGKRVISLETAELQFAVLSALSPEAEAQALAETLALGDALGDNAMQLAEAWRTGAATTLEALLYEGLDESEAALELYEAMVFRRNEGMADGLVAAVDAAGPRDVHFMVVGAAHFVGERNVRALLESRGYRVEHVAQAAPR